MQATPDRLERLLKTQLGECCDEDVERRCEELEALTADIPDRVDDNLTALQTLGNETRYRIARLIAAADRELCVCEIAPLVDVSDSAVSHALSDLKDAGLLTRRKEGTWHYYDTTARAERLFSAVEETRGDDG